ncbi:nuclease-related domain-containing protein [Bacillus timonensis]|uniref:nuclease-related domain-containing protein n=1 Tax=Bacillus timonensis TaxID=1033734 RepID=UPI000289103F|nr:nuclease-related domain-containing protein [Bacillus timonensis]
MIYKSRGENTELELFRTIQVRKRIGEKDENNYKYLEKGWLGEKQFDQLFLTLTNECLILNNLLFEVNNTQLQIDSLLITSKEIIIFEVKNFEGDIVIDGNRWHLPSGKEIKNPLIQFSRCESLFRQLLEELRFTLSVESKLEFINPEFYLYEAPVKAPFVFHAQLGRLFKKLDTLAAGSLPGGHLQLAEKLVSLHIKDTPYKRLPVYNYEELEKGIVCMRGCSFMVVASQNYLVCLNCGDLEHKESAVLRSVKEFRLLFPERKNTTSQVTEWCGVISSRLTIRKYLLKEYKLVTTGRTSHFVKKDE